MFVGNKWRKKKAFIVVYHQILQVRQNALKNLLSQEHLSHKFTLNYLFLMSLWYLLI